MIELQEAQRKISNPATDSREGFLEKVARLSKTKARVGRVSGERGRDKVRGLDCVRGTERKALWEGEGHRRAGGGGGAPGSWVGGTGLCRTWESTESSPGGPTLPTGLEHLFFGIHSSYRSKELWQPGQRSEWSSPSSLQWVTADRQMCI